MKIEYLLYLWLVEYTDTNMRRDLDSSKDGRRFTSRNLCLIVFWIVSMPYLI